MASSVTVEPAPHSTAGDLGRSEFQPLEILAYGLAIALAARHGNAAGQDQDEISTRRAADLSHVPHVDEAGAADSQHGLGLKGFLRLLQGTARVEGLAPYGEAHVVAVRLDHLHLRHIQHVHAAARFGEHARLRIRLQARTALELLEECSERALAVEAPCGAVPPAY